MQKTKPVFQTNKKGERFALPFSCSQEESFLQGNQRGDHQGHYGHQLEQDVQGGA